MEIRHCLNLDRDRERGDRESPCLGRAGKADKGYDAAPGGKDNAGFFRGEI